MLRFKLKIASTMKLVFAITVTILFAVNLNGIRAIEDTTYTNKYDNIDLQEVVQNQRLFGNYMKCLLDEGPCTPDGAELKKSLPDAMQTNCMKCTQHQKDGTDIVLQHLITNDEKLWERLQDKYDPTRIYSTQFLATKNPPITARSIMAGNDES